MVRFHRPSTVQVLDCSFLTLFFAMVLAILYRHGILGTNEALVPAGLFQKTDPDCHLDADDPYRCKALLNHGRWLDPPSQTELKQSFHNWQPPGCMMYEYRSDDISSCLASRKMIFIGDSTIRGIFWATAKKLDHEVADYEERTAEKHANIKFNRAHVNLDFIWDPFLNSSNLQQLLASQRNTWDSGMREFRGNTSTATFIIGGGLWHARHLRLAAQSNFEVSIFNVISSTTLDNSMHLGPTSSWAYQEMPASRNLVIIAPVQDPLYGFLNTSSKAKFAMTPTRINLLNDYLRNVSNSQGVPVVWSHALMTRHEEAAYEKSGVHVIDTIARQKADILLNMRCNAAITRLNRYPMDKTCCNHYLRPNWVQVVILVGSATVLPLILLLTFKSMREFVLLKS